jgi:hypothetical protein
MDLAAPYNDQEKDEELEKLRAQVELLRDMIIAKDRLILEYQKLLHLATRSQ